jgi:NAD(P)-dependent dehydrogenase (short-subunit alcohol dehydrogenase family)
MKTIVITGVTSGIGKALVKHFLKKDAHVIGISRNNEKLLKLESELKHEGLKNFDFVKADFSILSDIDEACKVLNRKLDHIDVLINNAAIVPQKKSITVDGFETQFQVNHLAVVKLTHGLLSLLRKKKGIVITTSSNAHRGAKFSKDNLQTIKHYSLIRSYQRSKLYNILFTRAFNEYVFRKIGIYAYAVHPGLVKTEIGTKDTSKFSAFMWKLFTKRGIEPEEAIETYDYLIYKHGLSSDFYFVRSTPENPSIAALSDENRDYLWQVTNEMLKIEF